MKINKKLLFVLSSLPVAALPMVAISCKNDLNKVIKNLKVESNKDVSTIKASEFTKENLKTNLDSKKYEITDLELLPNDKEGKLTLTFKIKSLRKNDLKSDLIKKVITEFTKEILTPEQDDLQKMEEETKKIKAKIAKNISETLVNSLSDEDVELEGYDKSKYNINDLTLDKSKAEEGILRLTYKLVLQKNPDLKLEKTLEVPGFKKFSPFQEEGESEPTKIESGWNVDANLKIDKLNKMPTILDEKWFTKYSEKNGVKSFFMNTYKGSASLHGKSSSKLWKGPEVMSFVGVIDSNYSYTNHLKPTYKNKNTGKISNSGFLQFDEEDGKYVIRFRLFDFKNKRVSKMVYKLVFLK